MFPYTDKRHAAELGLLDELLAEVVANINLKTEYNKNVADFCDFS